MLLVKDNPSNLYLVAISLLTILCIILCIVSGTFYFLLRRKSGELLFPNIDIVDVQYPNLHFSLLTFSRFIKLIWLS